MKIFLIRHAEAIDYETETVKDDELRFITQHGRKLTRKIAKALKTEFMELEKIFTSPLVRAVQTAEVFAVVLKFKGDIELVNEMKNEATIVSLQKLIEDNKDLDSIALVGHEPKMSLLVKSLSDKNNLPDFEKSSVCLIDYDTDSHQGIFKWYFNSKELNL